jgi:hypothetical protein
MTFKIIFFAYIFFNLDSTDCKCFQICEQGWTPYNGNCYFYNPIQLDNEIAKLYCSNLGATLANIHNEDDLSFALSINKNIDKSFWVYILTKLKQNIKRIIYVKVGGSAIEMFKYQLPDGSLFNHHLFCKANFRFIIFISRKERILFLKGDNEPNNSGGDSSYIRERCINRISPGNCLNDEHCEFKFPSICEKKATTALTSLAPTTTKTSQSYQKCEPGWTLHNDNCYFHISDRLDNESAKRRCSYYGATLVNIHNKDDLNFVLSINRHDAVFWVNI